MALIAGPAGGTDCGVRTLGARVAGLSLASRFALASAAILVAGMVILGAWVTREIETSVLRRVAADSALYVEALVGPAVQGLADGTFGEDERRDLARALEQAAIARRVVSVKVWSTDGTIVYATDPHLVGSRPASEGLAAALAGSVMSSRSDLSDEENAYERALAPSLLETYIPVRLASTDRVIAVAEFYQLPDLLEAELARARLSTWLVIAGATGLMYVLLAGMVRAGSDTIEAQRRALQAAVRDLSTTSRRLREVSASRAETDEAGLRRVAREIHDGLAQDLATALLTLERGGSRDGHARAAIESALAEVRSLARGLALPDLAPLSLHDVIAQACADHQRKTGRTVARAIDPLPAAATTPVKIAVYRVLQEALSNAFRHAPGSQVTVRARLEADVLQLECADDGPGVPAEPRAGLGVQAMRERVELLGGRFEIGAPEGRGTVVRATLPLRS